MSLRTTSSSIWELEKIIILKRVQYFNRFKVQIKFIGRVLLILATALTMIMVFKRRLEIK